MVHVGNEGGSEWNLIHSWLKKLLGWFVTMRKQVQVYQDEIHAEVA